MTEPDLERLLRNLAQTQSSALEIETLLILTTIAIAFFVALEPIKNLFATLMIRTRRDFAVGDSLSFSNGREGELTQIGPLHLALLTKAGHRLLIPTHKVLTESFEVQNQRHGTAVVLSLPVGQLNRQQVERIAHLCPYKRLETDVRVSSIDGEYKISMEIAHRDTRPWVFRYFEENLR